MRDLPVRQKIVYDLLREMSANNAVKITNARLARELAERKNMKGYDDKPVADPNISRYLSELEDKKLIRIEQGPTTRDRVIYILGWYDYFLYSSFLARDYSVIC
jgi:hypothetical protein